MDAVVSRGADHASLGKPRGIGLIQSNPQIGALIVVDPVEHMAVPIEPRQGRAIAKWNRETENLLALGKGLVKTLEKGVRTLAGLRRERHQFIVTLGHVVDPPAGIAIKQIDLVERLDEPAVDRHAELQFTQHAMDVVALGFAVTMGDVAHVDDDVGGYGYTCVPGGRERCR
jgi:hypothetical protein